MFIPKRVIFEKGSLDTEIGQNIYNKVKDNPKIEIINASSNRIKSNIPGDNLYEQYRSGKETLVVGERKSLKFQTCKPSANYQLPLVSGCMGRCEYCYLNTQLGDKPYIMVFVNLDDILKKAYLRGAFLGGGSISDPEKNYHMEFVTNNEDYANSLRDLINSFGLNSKIVARKNSFVVYLKESEQISDLLSMIGAYQALLSLQSTKIVKEMRNNVNRIVNCETANLSKTVNAAVRQVENIKLIQNKIGISSLPENLQEIALLRVENEDMSLKELGEMLNPPISKSGVNHRLKKIEQIANDLK